MNVLEQYRLANEARDFDAVKQVWPGVHPNVQEMLKDLDDLQFKFAGEPKIELQLAKNQAVAMLTTKITEVKGRDKRSRDTIARVVLSRATATNRWIILSVVHKLAG
jgi:hypothetical protein